ncbi:HTH-type transcriptional activator RhaR [Paenibacillus solanacearum]|uniref:HTH-type transcriptional activator RhaR n=1 Tax=Paenibacillus solanacearum TaxID=2048548 RepID=A0A916K4Q3_9BACL|nr:AraC family transcriptional regulator [Paenibacillus solanacearum]CAG7637117.1 HTH-type transcriptional activator RhaR [Paenibacillus solanacearum]
MMPNTMDCPLQEIQFGYSNSVIINTSYHYHDNYEIYFLISGSSEFFVKDRTYSVSNLDILFIPKGTLHKNNYISRSYERTVINFTEEYIGSHFIAKMTKLFEQCIYKPQDPELIKKLFSMIGKEIDKNDDLSSALIKSYFIQLISYFIRNQSEFVYHCNNNANPTIERLIRFINANYHVPITLDSASAMFNLSKSHLSRLFLKTTGFGFKEYVQIIRIYNAKNMLKITNHSIRQIAFDCGFNDSNYFSKTFKESTGLSPLQYRKHQKRKGP